tara:strand:+ start:5807 stop:6121 length:315 start_codon:yes stop_codon:yes gene_type:complete
MNNQISNKEFKKIVNSKSIECSSHGASLNIDANGVFVEANLNNDFHLDLSFWLSETVEAELTENQQEYLSNLMIESLGEHKESYKAYQQESIYDSQDHALSLIY